MAKLRTAGTAKGRKGQLGPRLLFSSRREALTPNHGSQPKRHNLATRAQQDARAHSSQSSRNSFLSGRQSFGIVLLLLVTEERAVTRGSGVGAGVLLIELV